MDETDDPEALRRLKELEAIDAIRQRFTLAEALSVLEVGRSTCYERKRRLREEPGSAPEPSEEPPRAAVDDGGREAGVLEVQDAPPPSPRSPPLAAARPVPARCARTVCPSRPERDCPAEQPNSRTAEQPNSYLVAPADSVVLYVRHRAEQVGCPS